MDRKIPSLLGLALTNLLSAQGWTATEVAQRAGISKATMSRYQADGLPRERLDELATLMGLDPADVEGAVLSACVLHPEAPPGTSPVEPAAEEHRVLSRAAARAYLDAYSGLRAGVRRAKAEQALEDGRRKWLQLKPFTGDDLRELLHAPVYDQWGLAVVLCRESEKSAADRPPRALELAEAAVHVARRVPGPFGIRLQGSCTGYLGNAQRVCCQLDRSEESFAQARSLWREGEDDASLLSEAYLLDMEASLRRDQRNFERAIELHEQAIEAAGPHELGSFLLNKSATLEEKGAPEEALHVLARARLEVDGERQPRLRWVLLFNEAASRCRMGDARTAEGLIDEIRALAVRLRNAADLTRTLWLQSNIDAGLGRREQAISGLEQVRRDFEGLENPYDFGLASLDLALLLREEGLFAEIEILAARMLEIFKALKIDREALSSFILFQEAARNRNLTTEMIEQLRKEIAKARSSPGPRKDA
jgi:tetratricopeptide (TPR) repeat protein/DNA-binding Xre family transcriptional regulator